MQPNVFQIVPLFKLKYMNFPLDWILKTSLGNDLFSSSHPVGGSVRYRPVVNDVLNNSHWLLPENENK